MPGEDGGIERLRAALDELTAQDTADLLAEARVQARERVRQILTDAMVDSMLDGVRLALDRREPARSPVASEPARPPVAPAPPRPSAASEPARSAVPPGPGQAEDPKPAPPPPDELGWYVYGVIAGADSPAWTLPGIDRAHGVATLKEGSLAAVVSRVTFEEFGETKLREHLGDMAWVEATARAHEGVLEQTRSQVTVIPMRMCTVYQTEDRLRDMLRREAEAFTEALAHLDGKTEMGVKVFVTGASAGAAEPEPEFEGPGAGAAYMQRRLEDRDRREEAAQRLEQSAEEIHFRLRTLSDDGLLTPPQRPEASGRRADMILNGVYLVADDALDAFRTEVSELAESFASEGLELELTGPWPAYNFVPGTIGAAW